ncbi:hypothetical protein ATANTOWER_011113 [Ataeniobius toweri]|uniref:Uncharacterized protein n=1 Tax=Ataeniobius toweri TaxID=208326 RepID=A0ABU7AFM1_9TELE|nr:hypothetical protein [Ataeniobius toweri]
MLRCQQGVYRSGSAVRVEQHNPAGRMFYGGGEWFTTIDKVIFGFIILAAVFGFLLIIGLIILLVYCTCIEKRGPPPGQPLCRCWKTEREAMTEPPPTYFLFPLNPPGNPEENLPCPSTHWVMYPGQATSDVVQVSNANQISLRTY